MADYLPCVYAFLTCAAFSVMLEVKQLNDCFLRADRFYRLVCLSGVQVCGGRHLGRYDSFFYCHNRSRCLCGDLCAHSQDPGDPFSDYRNYSHGPRRRRLLHDGGPFGRGYDGVCFAGHKDCGERGGDCRRLFPGLIRCADHSPPVGCADRRPASIAARPETMNELRRRRFHRRKRAVCIKKQGERSPCFFTPAYFRAETCPALTGVSAGRRRRRSIRPARRIRTAR